ncbi:MAG: NADH-quinone oxidoreductase subunit L [Planctomycetota bacterium]|jgi:NADH-quinone oxidoreductase subunit L
MDWIYILLVLIPALPLAAAVLTAALGKHLLRGQSHLPTVAAIALSCVASVVLVFQVQREAGGQAKDDERVGYEKVVQLWTWVAMERAHPQADPIADPETTISGDFHVDIALRADPLTAFMLATVTFVSLLVAVYSIGYMHGDPGYWRFFSYISLFVFSMTMLVSASNFLLLYVFWEAVGLCSYLLIGFWYRKPEAAAAGKKAFLVNRVGDFGFALGVFLIWTTFGTLNFHDVKVVENLADKDRPYRVVPADTEVPEGAEVLDDRQAGVLGQTALQDTKFYEKRYWSLYQDDWKWVATAVCLLLMLGACGKSAQFPLHVWLPDAMEGPTPVSALIHAATMVTAGVYMVARCVPLFVASTCALQVVAVIGAFTALLAALIALTQTDLKRILAYSTISQLGYMFLGLGAATLVGVTAGMFHLFTHAFFKALLFLGAGSVMHAMGGVIDVRRFGGLRRLLPWTYGTFLIGCLALAGFPLLAGFFSKDEILAAVHEQHEPLYQVLFWAAAFTALLTAFYTFRAFFLTFHGEEQIPKEAGDHAHESPRSMIGPLVILAIGSVVVGYLYGWIPGFLKKTPSLAYGGLPEHAPGAAHGGHGLVVGVSIAVVLVGIGSAWLLYVGRRALLEQLTRTMGAVRLYQLSHGKFFFDEIYGLLVVKPLEGLAWLSYWVDRYLIDKLVDAVGMLPKLFGATLRPLQNGMVQFYALAMLLGLLVLIGALLM